MKKILVLILLVFVVTLSACTTDKPSLRKALDTVVVPEEVRDYELPIFQDGYIITWSTDDSDFLRNNKIVPTYFTKDIILSAVITDGENALSKTFSTRVLESEDAKNDVELELLNLIDSKFTNIELDGISSLDNIIYYEGNAIVLSFESDNKNFISNTGSITYPLFEQGTQIVSVDVTGSLFNINVTNTYDITLEKLAYIKTQDELDLEYVTEVAADFNFGYSEITGDIYFSTMSEFVSIFWQSNNEAYLSSDGSVTRPSFETGDVNVTLSALFSYNNVTYTKIFYVTVLAEAPSYDVYYQGAEGLDGSQLKSFLHNLIDDHTMFPYTSLWTYLSETDKDPNNPNNVILFYTGMSISNDEHGGLVDEWNREHVWAKSHGDFGNITGPGSDLHHIRPTDVSVNSARSALDFDEGGTVVYNGSIPTSNLKDGDSFEPRDEVKGDVARMIFYMAVRYEGDDGFPDLELNDSVNNSGPYMGRLSILLKWHQEDPPDAFEMNRNEVIYLLQGNRNPFIDYPEFAELLFKN